MPRTTIFPTAALVLMVANFFAGCERAKAQSRSVAHIVISGDTSGWITPCGCTSNQSGGLPRRATYLATVRAKPDTQVVYLDVGGAPAGTSEYQRVRFESILRGELKMGLAAHNVGRAEAMLGAPYLRDVASRLNVPLLSTNLRDEHDESILPQSLIVQVAGTRVLVLGVISPSFAGSIGTSLRILDPRAAIAEQRKRRAGEFDAMIVLAYLPDDELSELALALPEADAVVGGPTGQAIAPKQIGPTLLAAATNKGKFVIDLAFGNYKSQEPWTGAVVELGPQFNDDPEQMNNLHAYQSELVRRDFLATDTGLTSSLPAGAPASYRIAGSESCRTCHTQTNSTWEASHHFRALADLKPRGFEADPSCQQCHTTGFGLPGGFESLRRTEVLGAVGCESCHGPSAGHVHDPKLHTPFTAADQCIRCHDPENSPRFKFTEYWPKISHGRKTEKKPS